MKSPWASSVEMPTGDVVDTLVCHVPRSGRPVETANHVLVSFEPLCPFENVTCSATRTAASVWLPTLMSPDRTRSRCPPW